MYWMRAMRESGTARRRTEGRRWHTIDDRPHTAMQRTDFRFFERLRVRWAEIDAQQIVFNGHYLMYFDTAIAGYWRARVGNSSILFQAGAFRQEQLLVSGELVYVFADPKAKQALPVPPPLRALF